MFPTQFLHKLSNVHLPIEIPGEDFYMELEIYGDFNDDDFFEFCEKNHPFRIERNKHGKIIIMAPVGFEGGQCEGKVYGKLFVWHEKLGEGWITNPSVAFKLPDGSTHAPDSAWISDEKIAQLTAEERKKFPPVVPDFVIEIRSESDNLKKLKNKMESVWMANGVRLAWLIDPLKKKAYIYRQNKKVETVSGFENKLSGEAVCPGFVFDLSFLLV